jgi:hypothetical protein
MESNEQDGTVPAEGGGVTLRCDMVLMYVPARISQNLDMSGASSITPFNLIPYLNRSE